MKDHEANQDRPEVSYNEQNDDLVLPFLHVELSRNDASLVGEFSVGDDACATVLKLMVI